MGLHKKNKFVKAYTTRRHNRHARILQKKCVYSTHYRAINIKPIVAYIMKGINLYLHMQ